MPPPTVTNGKARAKRLSKDTWLGIRYKWVGIPSTKLNAEGPSNVQGGETSCDKWEAIAGLTSDRTFDISHLYAGKLIIETFTVT